MSKHLFQLVAIISRQGTGLATQLITEADLKVEYISTRTVRRAATAFVIVEWLRQAAADPL